MKIYSIDIIYAIVLFLVVFLCFPINHALAHLVGQAPFFRVNGTFAGFYNVPSSSLDNFNLPQDAAPTTYLINTPIDLELDTNQLPVPAEIVKKTTFAWDFGDGQKGDGLRNTHTYKKMGSYLLTITASYNDNGQIVPPQVLETIMLQILPDKNYQLPQAIIQINGQTIHNPTADTIHFEPGKTVTFDAGLSTARSSKISSYFWDLGDSKTSDKKQVTHTYSSNYQLAFPLLRIKDTNGFIVDNYSQLDSMSGKGKQVNVGTPHQLTPKKSSHIIWYLLGGFAITVIIAGIVINTRRKQKRS